MAPNEAMLNLLGGHDDGDHIEVPNLVKMFSIVALVIKGSVQMQEPWGVDERLNIQHGEAWCQVWVL